MGIARTKRYVPVQPQTDMRIARYQAIALIGVVLPAERERRRRRKGRTWRSDSALPIPILILAFRLLDVSQGESLAIEEKKTTFILPVRASWGTGASRQGFAEKRNRSLPVDFGRYQPREKEEGEEKENLEIRRCSPDPDPCPRASQHFAERIFGDRREKKATFLLPARASRGAGLLTEASQGDFFSPHGLLRKKK
ncbi:hypothetical protein BHM03_00022602 [Ensete ventricosum]|nr:hypothetical protein BHM03_00022602 [Ensete ventricosum]